MVFSSYIEKKTKLTFSINLGFFPNLMLTCVLKLLILQFYICFRQNNAFLSSENDGDPEVMLELLARIGQNIMRANELEK